MPVSGCRIRWVGVAPIIILCQKERSSSKAMFPRSASEARGEGVPGESSLGRITVTIPSQGSARALACSVPRPRGTIRRGGWRPWFSDWRMPHAERRGHRSTHARARMLSHHNCMITAAGMDFSTGGSGLRLRLMKNSSFGMDDSMFLKGFWISCLKSSASDPTEQYAVRIISDGG